MLKLSPMLNEDGPGTAQAWKELSSHKEKLENIHMRDLFAEDPHRFEKFHIELSGLILDYSKHRMTEETVALFSRLIHERSVLPYRDDMANGKPVNQSENRPVLHMALRGSCPENLKVDGENVQDFVQESLNRMKELSAALRNGQITDIVNIGIGGSDLGIKTVYEALQHETDGPSLHFLSNIDGEALDRFLKTLNPETTAFIVVSKSFSTQETMLNAGAVKKWVSDTVGENSANAHFFAVTAQSDKAEAFGIPAQQILPLRSWIGGRYSVWSAVGLGLCAALGYETFEELLDGAQAMDRHFLESPAEKNMPIILACLGTWYRNFWEYPAHAILPYDEGLKYLPAYLQQLDMESNGKCVSNDGRAVASATGPVVFGETGTNAQHAFMQLLHQGCEIVPCDFILVTQKADTFSEHHRHLIANALAQSQALMEGRENKEEPHRNFPGNRPSSVILLKKRDAYHLGMLMALYEHKVFVQGAIWGINSFDQWGVELGKTLAGNILNAFETGSSQALDGSTLNLVHKIKTQN